MAAKPQPSEYPPGYFTVLMRRKNKDGQTWPPGFVPRYDEQPAVVWFGTGKRARG